MKKRDNFTEQIVKKLNGKLKFWFIVFVLIFGAFLLDLVYPLKIVTVQEASTSEKETIISRNLERAYRLLPELPNELPEMAWLEDLPRFMKKDFEDVLKNGDVLKYTYFNVELTFKRDIPFLEDDYCLALYVNFKDKTDRIKFYLIKDVSVYKKNNAIYFYGWTDDEIFERLVINENFISREELSDRANDVSIGEHYDETWNVCEDYVLLRDENHFSLWKEGEEIFKTDFEFGEVQKISKRYSIVATTENELYGINIYIAEDHLCPMIEFKYIGEVDDINPLGNSGCNYLITEFPTGSIYEFPIFEKDDGYYACLPNDFKAYASCSIANKGTINQIPENYDLSQRLVKLTEDNFCSAKIYFDYSRQIYGGGFCWLADMRFKDNGFCYTYVEDPILGYDREYSLTDSEEQKLTKEVFSIEEYWQTVAEIRATYEKYYEKP